MCKKCILIGVCILLFTGCWDKIEINDTAFIIALGVDVKEDQYIVSYVYPNLPVYTGQSEGTSLYARTVQDETMEGALKKLAAQMSKTLNFEHMEALVLGTHLLNDAAKFRQLTDYMGRSSEYPRRIPVLAAWQPEAVLQPENSETEAVGMYINGIFENHQSVIGNFRLVLQDVLTATEQQESFLIPVLHVNEGGFGIRDTILYDGKITGVLTMEEMEALSWLREASEGMHYAMALDEGYVSLAIEDSSCSYHYALQQGKLTIRAEIQAKMQIREYAENEDLLFDQQRLSQLESQAEEQLASEADAMIRRMQKVYKADLVSFLDPLKFKDRRFYMELSEQWDSLYTHTEFEVQAEVHIENIGIKESS